MLATCTYICLGVPYNQPLTHFLILYGENAMAIVSLDKRVIWINIFLFLDNNICCGY